MSDRNSTPRPHAERAPEGEVTAAVERLAKALAQLEPDESWPTNAELGGSLTGTRDDEFRDGKRDEARELLAELLDVEEMVGALASHATWRSYGQHGHGLECSCGVDLGEHSMAVNANDVHQRHQAEALRAAILGGAA